MSTPREPAPGMAVLSVLGTPENLARHWPDLEPLLVERLGPAISTGPDLPFEHTDYYHAEMGSPLARRLLGFDRMVPLDSLPQAKQFTDDLEQRFARDGRRTLNLDPGLLTPERLLLATHKNFIHRVYLGQGVFADLTLIYSRSGWQALPWTFADYASPELQERLTALRAIHLDKLALLRQP